MKAVLLAILLLPGILAPMQAPQGPGRSEVVPLGDGIFFIVTASNEVWNVDIRRYDTAKPLAERRIQMVRYDGPSLPSREVKVLSWTETARFFQHKVRLSSEDWAKVEALLRSEQGPQ